jgi:hypothetical protein
MKNILIALLVMGLAGCVAGNGYSKFYRSVPGATPEKIAQLRASPPADTPLVTHASKFPDPKPFYQQGYAVIGYSSFNSGHNEPDSEAIAQAKKMGADLVVVVDPNYTGSVTSQIPLTTPTSTTSYTNGSATAYGSGGSVSAYGNSTTTTYGSKTTYIPMTVNRYNYGAVYFVKQKFILGVHWRPLKNEERQMLQSNSGLYVDVVVNDTPAFRNDILPGDIIESVNGQRVYDAKAASNLLGQLKGQLVSISLYRDGHVITKAVQLNQ